MRFDVGPLLRKQEKSGTVQAPSQGKPGFFDVTDTEGKSYSIRSDKLTQTKIAARLDDDDEISDVNWTEDDDEDAGRALAPGTVQSGDDGEDDEDDGPAPAPVPGTRPAPPADLDEHTQRVEAAIGQALKDGLATEAQFSLDGEGVVWEPERAKLHNQIVDEIWAAQAVNVPNEGKGLFSGGLGGAGKTTTLARTETGIDARQYFTVNPDDVKEVLAAKGMVPDVPGAEFLSPMERVALIHEESSHIANMLAQRAYMERKNLTWDITMASESSVASRLNRMRATGYSNIQAVFVDIPVEKSVERAMGRYSGGLTKHRAGEGAGGRYVPPAVIRKNVSPEFSSKNRTTFEALRNQFDDFQVWDNSVDGRDARLVYRKGDPDLDRLTEEARSGITDNDRAQREQSRSAA